jgi:hypothetical protein
MGEVYSALDTRLGRKVAVKILPAAVAGDPARRQRFEHEARAVAALNHPNIIVLYDIGEGYFVTELVDGASLRGLKPGLRRALEICSQIASGLAAAHAAGIVHRDLKPDNVLLKRDGQIKILDFGLAKVKIAPADSATETLVTEPGILMGTVGYMSPEQVRGAEIDGRSDIFNLGLILYELLSGRRAFHGEAAVEIMTAILRQDAPELPEAVPTSVRQVVAHCLEREPGNRFQSAKDLAFALSQAAGQSGAPPVHVTSRGWPRWLGVAIAGALLGLAAGVLLRPAPKPFWTQKILGGPEIAWGPRLSPDGHTLAMLAMVGDQSQVAVMRPDAGDWTVLTHEGNAGSVGALSWSPDGSRVYYDRAKEVMQGVYSVPVLGGESRLVLENAGYPEALPDGSLLVARLSERHELQVVRFWPESGKLQELPFQVAGTMARPMQAFPGGRAVAAIGGPIPMPAGQAVWQLYVLDLVSGRARRLSNRQDVSSSTLAVTRDGRQVIFSPSGGSIQSIAISGRSPESNLFPTPSTPLGIDTAADGSIFLDQSERLTELVRLVKGHAERLGSSRALPSVQFTLLPDGRPVWTEASAGRRRLVVIERGREPAPVILTSDETAAPVSTAGPGLLAAMLGGGGKMDIGIVSSANGRIVRRIPFDKGTAWSMAATPDGRMLYCVAAHAVWAVPAAGGVPVRFHDGDTVAMDPDGKFLVVMATDPAGTRIFRIPLDGSPAREIAVRGELHPTPYLGPRAISRDGQLLDGLESDSWYYVPGIIDLSTGQTTLIPTDLAGDYFSLNWTNDSQVMAIVSPLRSAIWKFTPQRP